MAKPKIKRVVGFIPNLRSLMPTKTDLKTLTDRELDSMIKIFTEKAWLAEKEIMRREIVEGPGSKVH